MNIDVTSILDGWFADANRTFLVGKTDPEAERLVDVTRQCLALGMSAVRPGATVIPFRRKHRSSRGRPFSNSRGR